MIKSKVSVASGVLFASLMLVVGLMSWLQAANPLPVAQAGGLIDNSLDDFAGGSGNCFVAQSVNNTYRVILSPTVGTNFTETVSGVANGVLTVSERTVSDPPSFSPARTLEFSATFTGPDAQFIGFAENLSAGPWALFGTWGNGAVGNLYARTTDGTSSINLDLGDGLFGSPHRFRIEWGTTSITYTVYTDTVGTSATYVHGATIAGPMTPRIRDFQGAAPAPVLTVDWMRMSNYAPSPCVFTSRVISSGYSSGPSYFTDITPTLDIAAGMTVTFAVITSTDNSNWSAWPGTPVISGTSFNVGAAGYLQYRATLTTTDAGVTPQIISVQFGGHKDSPTAVRLTSFAAAGSDFVARGLLIGLSVAVLAIGGVSVIFRRRRIAG